MPVLMESGFSRPQSCLRFVPLELKVSQRGYGLNGSGLERTVLFQMPSGVVQWNDNDTGIECGSGIAYFS